MTRASTKGLPSMSDDAARTEALNVAGTFFQRKVAGEFRRRGGWRVLAEEYPVTYPQTGPLSERQSSAMDIWVANSEAWHGGSPGSPAFAAQIECKKADPGFIDWVFLLKHGDDLRFRHLILRRDRDAVPDHNLFVAGGNLHSLCDDGRELKGNYRGADRTKSTSSRIQDAARQAALATLSTALTLQRNPQPPLGQFRVIHLVPVVVTTANLFICEFALQDIQQATGKLPPKSAKYEPTEYVVYDYPLTGGLTFPGVGISGHISDDNIELLVKMHVLIVNAAKGLDALIDKAHPFGVLIEGL